jgi:hypothetical protein
MGARHRDIVTSVRQAVYGRAMRNRIATWINFVFASIVVLGVFLQVYFIASFFTGAGDSALDAHSFTGGVIVHGSELIVLISGLVAFWGAGKLVGLSALLFVFGTVQIFLAPPDDDPASGWVHGLHGLFALFVALLAAWIAYRDAQLLGLRQARGAEVTSPAAPAPAPPP